jgi:hypothetical protein
MPLLNWCQTVYIVSRYWRPWTPMLGYYNSQLLEMLLRCWTAWTEMLVSGSILHSMYHHERPGSYYKRGVKSRCLQCYVFTPAQWAGRAAGYAHKPSPLLCGCRSTVLTPGVLTSAQHGSATPLPLLKKRKHQHCIYDNTIILLYYIYNDLAPPPLKRCLVSHRERTKKYQSQWEVTHFTTSNQYKELILHGNQTPHLKPVLNACRASTSWHIVFVCYIIVSLPRDHRGRLAWS